jgi:hypothetical protein
VNREIAKRVADAVLYEGYMLYPYRPSAIKNRQRWSFGILYPPAYEEVRTGTERAVMHSEVLVRGDASARIQVQLRFLHLKTRQVFAVKDGERTPVESLEAYGSLVESCDQADERLVEVNFDNADGQSSQEDFSFAGSIDRDGTNYADEELVAEIEQAQQEVSGTVTTSSARIAPDCFKVTIDVENKSTQSSDGTSREQALLRSLLSAHLILTITDGEFISLLDPPEQFSETVKACHNVGNFPVLVGNEGERAMMLCSPILLYDYPQIAPESAGDFFDGTEMDEMLTLRVMTLTDSEKNEMRFANDHARALLERTERTAREQLERTHGAIRSMRPVSDDHE